MNKEKISFIAAVWTAAEPLKALDIEIYTDNEDYLTLKIKLKEVKP